MRGLIEVSNLRRLLYEHGFSVAFNASGYPVRSSVFGRLLTARPLRGHCPTKPSYVSVIAVSECVDWNEAFDRLCCPLQCPSEGINSLSGHDVVLHVNFTRSLTWKYDLLPDIMYLVFLTVFIQFIARVNQVAMVMRLGTLSYFNLTRDWPNLLKLNRERDLEIKTTESGENFVRCGLS